jgi:ADP-ribose pyrophosphatase YjhB (NUDIX family)
MPKTHSHVYTQPYIVVGALIIRDGKILLLQENHMPDKGKWNIPAGKLDYGENPIEAVTREVFEESGLKFKPTSILSLHSIHRKDVPGKNNTTHVLRIVFLGESSGEVSLQHGESKKSKSEIADYKWLSPEEILNMSSSLIRYHDLKNYVRDYTADKSYPLALITHIIQE